MAAGVTDRLWSVADIAESIETAEEKPGKRGPYRKRGGRARKFKMRHYVRREHTDGKGGVALQER